MQTIALKNNIKEYYFYKFQIEKDMNIFLKIEISPPDLFDQDFFPNKQEFILFVMKKEVK